MIRRQTLRQLLVLTGLFFCCMSDGFIFGQMSGMLEALRSKNDTMSLNENDVSWIASTINITCFCGFGLMAAITEIFGRRLPVTFLSTPVIFCWLMVYFANDKVMLLASRVMVGIFYGAIMEMTFINTGEYFSPNLRSYCLTVTCCLGCNLGTMLGHILCLLMHWRYVALIGIIPTAISAILPLFWVESPSWLVTKGRIQESEQAFKALHVPSETSDYELKVLLETQRTELRMTSEKSNSLIQLLKNYKQALKQKYFWKIAILLLVISAYRTVGGRVLLNTLAITLIQEITRSNDILKYTIVVDGLALLSSLLSCIIIKRYKMRNILFISGLIANFIQIILAISLYFWIGSEGMAWVKVILLALYFTVVSTGPYAVLETLLSELHPLEIKAFNIFCIGAFGGVMHFIDVQFAFKMFTSIGYHGVFFVHSLFAFLCLLYLYVYLPETKGRTLQEIQFYFKNNSFQDVLSLSQSKVELKILVDKVAH